MKRIVIQLGLVLTMACFPLAVNAQKGTGQGEKIKIDLEQPAGMYYWLFIPKGLNKKKVYPLILAMHGNGEKSRNRLNNMARVSTRSQPALVVSPQIQVSPKFEARPQLFKGWAEACMKIMEQVGKKYPIDPGRVVLEGFSMGSNCGSYLLWGWFKKDPENCPFSTFWMSSTCDPKWLQGPASPKIPYLLFCGSKETAVKGVVNVVKQARHGYRYLFTNNYDARYIEIPGMKHQVNRQCHEIMRAHLASLPTHSSLLGSNPKLPEAARGIVPLCLTGKFDPALQKLKALAKDQKLKLSERSRVTSFSRKVEKYLQKQASAPPPRSGSVITPYRKLKSMATQVKDNPALTRAFAQGLKKWEKASGPKRELEAWHRFTEARAKGGDKVIVEMKKLAQDKKLAKTEFGQRAKEHIAAWSDKYDQ